jgi:transposase InsO family protein
VATEPGERLYVDTSGPYDNKIINNQYWVRIYDQYSRMSWNAFTKEKSELPGVLEPFLIKFNGINNKVKFLRCDNAGEYQTKLRSLCNKLGIQPEYTAPYTPQMNGVVESKICH